MTALLTLEPREAGTETIDLAIKFDASLDELHKSLACPYSAVCYSGTDVCYGTE